MKNENMDTQEIKRLIELYFECGTDVRQERMLRDYFSSGHADGELKRYEALFSRSDYDEAAVPGDDFDMKILEMIQRPQVTEKAKRPAGRTMKTCSQRDMDRLCRHRSGSDFGDGGDKTR